LKVDALRMSEPESNWRPYWEQIEQLFDAAVPVKDPALFAARPDKYNAMIRLQQKLRRPRRAGPDGQYARYLVAGTIGNGKTSELFHLGWQLTDTRMVVFIDLWQHFEQTVREPDAMERLEPWESMGSIASRPTSVPGRCWCARRCSASCCAMRS
jgi:hypothetical protein